jgi:3-hydroxyacyl-[acyl-carrier-protein] dehydratase
MSAKFHREALAGEQLTYTTRVENLNETGARVSGEVHSGGELVAEAEIVFAHVTPDQLPAGLPDPKFVFSGELTHLLRMAEAAARTPAASG